MKRLFPLLTIIIILSSTHSHGKEKPWRKGKITFSTGDTLACTLRFTRKVKEGLLQIQEEGERLRILTPRQVLSFEFFDEKNHQQRYFQSLTMQPELSGKRHEVFMEVVFKGHYYSIVNHRMLGYSESSLEFNPFRSKTVVDNPYLLDNETNEVLPLTRENLFKMLRTKQTEVDKFFQSNGSPRSIEDYMKALEYHQALL